MTPPDHQVGITNSQEVHPDEEIAAMTKEMNRCLAEQQFPEWGRIAFSITERGKDDLQNTLAKHDVTVLHLDHEAIGIYGGMPEPCYDVRVEGNTDNIKRAVVEFGRRHRQEMVLIARKPREEDKDSEQHLGLTITLHINLDIEEAVQIAESVCSCKFTGATFVPKRDGELFIYNTDGLGMTDKEFFRAAKNLIYRLKKDYPQLTVLMQKFIISTPRQCYD